MSDYDKYSSDSETEEDFISDDNEYDFKKQNWHRNKHTLRYKSFSRYFKKSTNYELESRRYITKDNEIPLSNVDELFDNGLVNYQDFKTINKKHQWENIEDILEKSSIQIIKKWNPFEGVVTKTYKVPTEEYILKEEINKYNTKENWLKWNNEYYDPNYLYIYEGGDENDFSGKLKKYCKNVWDIPEINNSKVVCHRILNKKKAKNKKLAKLEDFYYEIDLGVPQYINHIVTFGKYPVKRIFPKHKNKISYSNKNYIYVIDDITNDSYVKKFTILYKDIITQKWIKYKDLDGNINSFTPKINEINIYTRYIRIKPIDFNNSKSMIVNIYIPEIETNITGKEEKEEDEYEIIEYTLTPSNMIEKRNDGYGERCYSPDWKYQQYFKEERKKKIKEMLDEQFESL
jgi:hypothetical protein